MWIEGQDARRTGRAPLLSSQSKSPLASNRPRYTAQEALELSRPSPLASQHSQSRASSSPAFPLHQLRTSHSLHPDLNSCSPVPQTVTAAESHSLLRISEPRAPLAPAFHLARAQLLPPPGASQTLATPMLHPPACSIPPSTAIRRVRRPGRDGSDNVGMRKKSGGGRRRESGRWWTAGLAGGGVTATCRRPILSFLERTCRLEEEEDERRDDDDATFSLLQHSTASTRPKREQRASPVSLPPLRLQLRRPFHAPSSPRQAAPLTVSDSHHRFASRSPLENKIR